MKRLILCLLLVAMSGCVAGLPKSGPAVVALTNQAEMTNNGVKDIKTGKACAINILGLVATGDASVEAAKRAGGISRVYTMDREIFGLNVYFIKYAKSCTVVRGS